MPNSDTSIPSTSIFNPETAEAWRFNDINSYFIIASSFIMLLVIVLLIYVAFKYRAKPGDGEPRQIHNNRLIEAVMIGIPFLMVSYFFYLTINAIHQTKPEMGNTRPTAIVTGNQWWWKISYPGTSVVTANEIHLPAGKKILVRLESADVIHDFWVPSFGPKADMIPGAGNYLWLTIGQPGNYYGACSEFCGKQHAWMRIKIVAQSQADFDQWLQDKARDAVKPAANLALKGEALFNKASCAGCHSIRGTTANGTAGPDLTHLASRETLLTGLLKNNSKNLYSFISNPEKVKPGVNMPRYIFKKDSLLALVAYLNHLK